MCARLHACVLHVDLLCTDSDKGRTVHRAHRLSGWSPVCFFALLCWGLAQCLFEKGAALKKVLENHWSSVMVQVQILGVAEQGLSSEWGEEMCFWLEASELKAEGHTGSWL